MRRLLAAVMVATATLAPAAAHQQKAAITTVAVNPRSGTLEVAHRFYLHDAEHALAELTGRVINLHAASEDRQSFASMVAASFALTEPDGTPVPLQLLGSEVERGYLWVYQEGPGEALVDGLRVRASALREVWPTQINTVNFTTPAGIASLQFQGATQVLTLNLTP